MPKMTLTRKLFKRVSDDIISKQVDYIIGRSLSGTRGKNWKTSVTRPKEPQADGNGWLYSRTINFQRIGGHESTKDKQWQAILEIITKSCQAAQFASNPWMIEGQQSTKTTTNSASTDEKNYGDINLDFNNIFDGIYERESQINIIISALETLKASEFQSRFHCVLHGPPGCGKTAILEKTAKGLGLENNAYIKLDATSTTEAGAYRLLFESDVVPPVLIVEEIEKTDEKNLRWLLGILDQRGEIRKTNFRIGHHAKNVKMLCLATVNNFELFSSLMSGALASRFSHEVYCPRPSRSVMQSILEREVKTLPDPNEIWIEKTLEFCYDDLGWDDPRKIIPVCVCGKDRLLDGGYQRDILKTLTPSNLEKCDHVLEKYGL